ncbi:MAG: putative zinc-binding metallopeptidase [Nitriliruptor sp.]
MHAFTCGRCGQLVFFHNSVCLRCDAPLGFDPERLRMVVVADEERRCIHTVTAGCNWLAAAPGEACASCRLTRTRPADGDVDALAAFAAAEAQKRRLVFNLRSIGLHLEPRDEVAGTGVAFDLLASDQQPVTTGHAAGVITLDLAESDDVHREQVRALMREPYRTVLGHFRHEIGHHLFTVIVTPDDLGEVRERFGDERADYQAALDRHYEHGAPTGWEAEHVSEYATMHPAEDWAETFAHYLHIRATLETAAAYRLRVDGPTVEGGDAFAADPASVDPASLAALIETWLPLSYALNAVSRSLGDGDLYPFVLPPAVIAKLDLVHRLVQRAAD